MPTLMQKIRLAIKGWSRRREEAQKEFLKKNATWGTPPAAAPAATTRSPLAARAAAVTIDIEGLSVAFVDDSGVITYYLDSETGDVVDVRDGTPLAAPRYRRVPQRSESTDAGDRAAFIAEHEQLRGIAADDFRRAIAADRSLERAWYNFKNDRVLASIEAWLRKEGLR